MTDHETASPEKLAYQLEILLDLFVRYTTTATITIISTFIIIALTIVGGSVVLLPAILLLGCRGSNTDDDLTAI